MQKALQNGVVVGQKSLKLYSNKRGYNMIVIKRDSSTSTFSPEKIQKAINKAAAAAMTESPDSLFYTDLLDYIETEYNKEALHIEQIQDAVIKCLFDYGYTNVADKFSEWRNIRDKVRSELKIRMHKDNQNITDKTLLLRNAEDDILVNWDPDFVYTELNKIVDLSAEEQKLVVKNVENRLVDIQDDIVEWELIQALTKNVLNNLFPNKVAKKDTFCLSEDFVSRLLTGKSNENSNVVNNNPSLIDRKSVV